MESEKIKLDSKNWNIKTEHRSRGRMKLTIKLSKEETEAFTNWKNTVMPEKMGEDEFMRQIFFRGMQNLNSMLENAAKEIMANPELRQKLEASGISFDTSGSEEPK